MADLKRLGVSGYNIHSIRGEGHHGLLRASHWEGDNIKIEIIADNILADAESEHIAKEYFPRFATFLYMLPILVLREAKFPKSRSHQYEYTAAHHKMGFFLGTAVARCMAPKEWRSPNRHVHAGTMRRSSRAWHWIARNLLLAGGS